MAAVAAQHVQLYHDSRGRWRFRVVGANGEKTAQSQAYATRSSAIRGARRARPGATIEPV
jgi:uncharacterized protein YegP (UPF0339 family)